MAENNNDDVQDIINQFNEIEIEGENNNDNLVRNIIEQFNEEMEIEGENNNESMCDIGIIAFNNIAITLQNNNDIVRVMDFNEDLFPTTNFNPIIIPNDNINTFSINNPSFINVRWGCEIEITGNRISNIRLRVNNADDHNIHSVTFKWGFFIIQEQNFFLSPVSPDENFRNRETIIPVTKYGQNRIENFYSENTGLNLAENSSFGIYLKLLQIEEMQEILIHNEFRDFNIWNPIFGHFPPEIIRDDNYIFDYGYFDFNIDLNTITKINPDDENNDPFAFQCGGYKWRFNFSRNEEFVSLELQAKEKTMPSFDAIVTKFSFKLIHPNEDLDLYYKKGTNSLVYFKKNNIYDETPIVKGFSNFISSNNFEKYCENNTCKIELFLCIYGRAGYNIGFEEDFYLNQLIRSIVVSNLREINRFYENKNKLNKPEIGNDCFIENDHIVVKNNYSYIYNNANVNYDDNIF